jgi:hypothetical protein
MKHLSILGKLKQLQTVYVLFICSVVSLLLMCSATLHFFFFCESVSWPQQKITNAYTILEEKFLQKCPLGRIRRKWGDKFRRIQEIQFVSKAGGFSWLRILSWCGDKGFSIYTTRAFSKAENCRSQSALRTSRSTTRAYIAKWKRFK